jgi:hypothetical protein
MLLEDLQFIFKDQFKAGEEKLYFMLIDNNCKVIERHPTIHMEDLLPCLSCFVYDGNEGQMPRFTKDF